MPLASEVWESGANRNFFLTLCTQPYESSEIPVTLAFKSIQQTLIDLHYIPAHQDRIGSSFE